MNLSLLLVVEEKNVKISLTGMADKTLDCQICDAMKTYQVKKVEKELVAFPKPFLWEAFGEGPVPSIPSMAGAMAGAS